MPSLNQFQLVDSSLFTMEMYPVNHRAKRKCLLFLS